jgi:cytoskeletal protein RodZ
MAIDLRKSVTDAGYIAIGAGVLGFQQAQQRRRDLQAQFTERSTDLRARAGDAGHYVVAHLASPRTVATSVTEQARDAVSPAVDAVRSRIEPAVEQLRGVPAQVTASVPESVKAVPAQVASAIPESVKGVPSSVTAAVGSGVDKVRSLRG